MNIFLFYKSLGTRIKKEHRWNVILIIFNKTKRENWLRNTGSPKSKSIFFLKNIKNWENGKKAV